MADDLQKAVPEGRPAALPEAPDAWPSGQAPCQEQVTSHVRRISVHVDEPMPGHFFWVLMEECDDASHWMEIASSDLSYDRWLDALHVGVRALEGYATDERTGPRAPGAAQRRVTTTST